MELRCLIADAHEVPMGGGFPHFIDISWARRIGVRRSLIFFTLGTCAVQMPNP